MEILGIGPSELLFVIIIALIVLGPRDMQKAGKTIGRWLSQLVRSDGWRALQRTTTELRNLPNNLMREANLEMHEATKDIQNSIGPSPFAYQTRPSPAPPTTQTSLRPKKPTPPPRPILPPTQTTMRKFFTVAWRVITFPFVLVFKIVTFPLRMVRKAYAFLNDDLENDDPLLEKLSALAIEAEARAHFWNHVEALRAHLLRMVVAIAIGVGISFYYTIPLMEYLAVPVQGLEDLQAIEVTEELGVYMRVALTSGIAIMLPYLAFELWLFAAPGLRPRERKFGLVGIPLATILFLTGMAFTYFVLLPTALPFLQGFTKIASFWTARDYFGFVTGLMLWIGLFFEFPLVIYILTSMGLVKPQILAQQWRLAIVIIAVIAAAVTPTVDPVNMGLVMLPMSLLYFISIGLSYIAYAGRNRRVAQAQGTEAGTS